MMLLKHMCKYDVMKYYYSNQPVNYKMSSNFTGKKIKNSVNICYSYFRTIKCYLTLQVQFVRETPDGDQLTEARFRVPPTTLSSMTDYDKESFLNTIMNLIDNFVSVGSGWKVHHLMSLSISFAPIDRC